MSDKFRVFIEPDRVLIKNHDLVPINIDGVSGFISQTLYEWLAENLTWSERFMGPTKVEIEDIDKV